MTHEAVEEITAVARETVPLGGLAWQEAFLALAAARITEPRAWRAT